MKYWTVIEPSGRALPEHFVYRPAAIAHVLAVSRLKSMEHAEQRGWEIKEHQGMPPASTYNEGW